MQELIIAIVLLFEHISAALWREGKAKMEDRKALVLPFEWIASRTTYYEPDNGSKNA